MRGIDQILAAIGALAQSETRRSLPELLCVDCARGLPSTAVAMTLVNDGGHQSVLGASDPLAARLEELQFDLGEGPSLEAFRSNLAVVHHDLGGTSSTPWPAFAIGARAVGIEAIIALPLSVGKIRLGSLCLVSLSPGTA
ncbi:GAF domain-containing protein [Nocardioides daejeonensis]|uniref:GAF domain-containing protein n=1 Tax=Nocardioides daejeonensis TaxID=1046556 RepID=UPI000D743DD4|nr:GAF domain-containing protein [Nocardioides daejeonensis]